MRVALVAEQAARKRGGTSSLVIVANGRPERMRDRTARAVRRRSGLRACDRRREGSWGVRQAASERGSGAAEARQIAGRLGAGACGGPMSPQGGECLRPVRRRHEKHRNIFIQQRSRRKGPPRKAGDRRRPAGWTGGQGRKEKSAPRKFVFNRVFATLDLDGAPPFPDESRQNGVCSHLRLPDGIVARALSLPTA